MVGGRHGVFLTVLVVAMIGASFSGAAAQDQGEPAKEKGIAQLREAGMVILGKTNLSEWANFRSERSSSGWSGVGGQTVNPFKQTSRRRTPPEL